MREEHHQHRGKLREEGRGVVSFFFDQTRGHKKSFFQQAKSGKNISGIRRSQEEEKGEIF